MHRICSMSRFSTGPRFCGNSRRETALLYSVQNSKQIYPTCMSLDSLPCRISDLFLDLPSLVLWRRESLGKQWLIANSQNSLIETSANCELQDGCDLESSPT